MDAGNLHSKDEWVRSEAAGALRRVAQRCSNPAAARALLSHAFAEYNGASGKLTSSEDKIAVLNVSTRRPIGIATRPTMKSDKNSVRSLHRELAS